MTIDELRAEVRAQAERHELWKRIPKAERIETEQEIIDARHAAEKALLDAVKEQADANRVERAALRQAVRE